MSSLLCFFWLLRLNLQCDILEHFLTFWEENKNILLAAGGWMFSFCLWNERRYWSDTCVRLHALISCYGSWDSLLRLLTQSGVHTRGFRAFSKSSLTWSFTKCTIFVIQMFSLVLTFIMTIQWLYCMKELADSWSTFVKNVAKMNHKKSVTCFICSKNYSDE